jgi:hypothetical protein
MPLFKLKRQSDTRRKRLRCASDTTNLSAGGSIFNSGLSGLGAGNYSNGFSLSITFGYQFRVEFNS